MAGTTTYLGITYPTSTDYVKDGATAIETVATGFDSAVAIPTYNAQTGTTYTFALTDVGKTVTASNASASTYTIPPTSSVAWPTGTTLEVTNLGAGVVTFAAGAGVTVTNTAATLAQYASAALIRTGLNAWTVTPRSGGASGLTLVASGSTSAAASLTLDSVFTSTYRSYKLFIDGTCSNNDIDVVLRLRSGGVTNTTSNYTRVNISGSAASGVTRSAATSQTSFSATLATGTTGMVYEGTFFAPQQAVRTGYQALATSLSDTIYQYFYGGTFTATTQFDGLIFTPSSGTITVTYRLYGMAD